VLQWNREKTGAQNLQAQFQPVKGEQMFTNRLFHLLLVAIILVTGCTPQITPVATVVQEEPTTTLRLAVSDGEDDPDAPYALEFIQQVKTLSNGNITIEPVWHAGDDVGDTYETGVIQHVREGTFDLGLTPSRAWDTDNVTSFQALQAPFLIDNDALAVAIAKSDIATRMLESLSATGVMGLTLWPEDLRHPFSPLPDNPILSPEDLAGLNFRVPISKTSNTLFASLGAEPMMADSGYDAGESGLLQGAYLSGIPTFTANVTFFAKYQTLFANSAAFEKLSEEQRAVLRQAAAGTQKKAVAEHMGDVQAGTAWCAAGGSIVLASEEQLAAFEKAAQPVFDSIKQDPFNAERMAEISELKAHTEPSSGASACAPDVAQASPEPGTETQVWSAGLPPNGVWQVELGVEDFARMGVSQAKAEKWGLGLYTWTFTDGKAQLDWKGKATVPPYESYTCWYDYAVDGDSVIFTNTSSDPSGTCDGAVENSQWRLDEQGLHLHLVSAKDGDSQDLLRATYEAKPWQKVADQ
jgi:TRAP-type C4-dicarboxylate transport system substrate-binding protein